MKKIFEMLKLNKKSKGSFVVEATLIFPLIMFIMFGIIYLTIVHYQNNVMIAESIRAMNRAGAYWQYIDMDKYGKYDSVDFTTPPFDSNMKKEGIINIEMIKNRNAYRTIIDILAEAGSKIFNIPIGAKKASAKNYVDSRIANIQFKQYKPQDKDFTTIEEVKGGGFMFFGEDLNINIGRAYINPMQNLARVFFGQDGILTERFVEKNIKVSSMISNQAEFIRNIDTVYDMGVNIYNLVAPKEGD